MNQIRQNLSYHTFVTLDRRLTHLNQNRRQFRPGEKLYEELLIGDNPVGTAHERIMKAREVFVPWAELSPVLVQMRQAAIQSNEGVIREILTNLVHGYRPIPYESSSPGLI